MFVVDVLFMVFVLWYVYIYHGYYVVRYNGRRSIDVCLLIMTENVSKGALTEAVYYILLSMLKPIHGYAVMQNIDKLTNGRVNLGAGTLYGAINTLLEKQWICAVNNDNKESRKKEYIITPIGRKMLQCELVRLEELLINGKNSFGGT